jgi:hypothetical protein
MPPLAAECHPATLGLVPKQERLSSRAPSATQPNFLEQRCAGLSGQHRDAHNLSGRTMEHSAELVANNEIRNKLDRGNARSSGHIDRPEARLAILTYTKIGVITQNPRLDMILRALGVKGQRVVDEISPQTLKLSSGIDLEDSRRTGRNGPRRVVLANHEGPSLNVSRPHIPFEIVPGEPDDVIVREARRPVFSDDSRSIEHSFAVGYLETNLGPPVRPCLGVEVGNRESPLPVVRLRISAIVINQIAPS